MSTADGRPPFRRPAQGLAPPPRFVPSGGLRVAVRVALRTLMFAVPILAVLAGAVAYLVYTESWQVAFKHPWMLLLLPAALLAYVLVFVLYTPLRAAPGEATAHLFASRGPDLAALPRGIGVRLMELPAALRLVALVAIVVALARPQRIDQPDSLELSGIDIVLALDLSGSMRASDLQPTRLQAAKEVIDDFILHRRTDRIGVVVFGKEAYTLVPLTLDYNVVRSMVAQMSLDVIDGSATAIGDGLGTALNRLRHSDARSKVVVLLTDGANNAGHVDPREAAQLARALHVKVYTILVGTSDEAPVQTGVDPLFGRPIVQTAHFPVDPKLLEEISDTTGGQFFRAVDRAALDQSFHTILDSLERSKIQDAGVQYMELYPWLVVLALAMLLAEVALASTRLRRFP